MKAIPLHISSYGTFVIRSPFIRGCIPTTGCLSHDTFLTAGSSAHALLKISTLNNTGFKPLELLLHIFQLQALLLLSRAVPEACSGKCMVGCYSLIARAARMAWRAPNFRYACRWKKCSVTLTTAKNLLLLLLFKFEGIEAEDGCCYCWQERKALHSHFQHVLSLAKELITKKYWTGFIASRICSSMPAGRHAISILPFSTKHWQLRFAMLVAANPRSKRDKR